MYREKPGVPKTQALIAIVDDDQSVREALASLIRSLGWKVEAFPSAADFLASPMIGKAACLIADVHMPNMSGVELYSRLVEQGHRIPTVLITAYPEDGVRARVLADGVLGYLAKPLDENALLECVRSAFDRAKPEEGHR
jgi:FixJ family two-component response regulator